MKLRTIEKTISELKQADSDCCLTKTALRRMVKSGQVPYVMAGNRFLIDLDTLPLYLQGDNTSQTNNVVEYGTIRKVSGV